MFQRLPKGTVREDEQPIDFTVTKDHLTYSEGDILELGGLSVGLGVQYFAASTDMPLLYTSTCF